MLPNITVAMVTLLKQEWHKNKSWTALQVSSNWTHSAPARHLCRMWDSASLVSLLETLHWLTATNMHPHCSAGRQTYKLLHWGPLAVSRTLKLSFHGMLEMKWKLDAIMTLLQTTCGNSLHFKVNNGTGLNVEIPPSDHFTVLFYIICIEN